jgi:hypothetical protein
MPRYASFTPVHWSTLTDYRAETERAGGDPAVLRSIVAGRGPFFVSELEQARLAAARRANAPFGAILSLSLRADPAGAVDEAVHWLSANAPNLLDDVLVELARVGPWRSLEVETEIILGYYSQAYRLIVVGMAGDEVDDGRRYDGDPALLDALGGRLFPDPADVVLHSQERTSAIAAGLSGLLPPPRAVGDVGPLYDFWDDFFDDSAPLDDLCQDTLAALADLYADAAARDCGIKLIA